MSQAFKARYKHYFTTYTYSMKPNFSRLVTIFLSFFPNESLHTQTTPLTSHMEHNKIMRHSQKVFALDAQLCPPNFSYYSYTRRH